MGTEVSGTVELVLFTDLLLLLRLCSLSPLSPLLPLPFPVLPAPVSMAEITLTTALEQNCSQHSRYDDMCLVFMV